MTSPARCLRNLEDFEDCVLAYHDESLPGDTLTYLYVASQIDNIRQEANPPGAEIARLLLNGYLRSWGGMSRVLGSEPDAGPDLVLDDLTRGLQLHWKRIRGLQEVPIWDVELVESDVRDLFEGIHAALLGPRIPGRARSHSPVGVGKLLHVILPELCVIWDRECVIVPGLEKLGGGRLTLSADATGYVKYLAEKARQFRDLADRLGKPPKALTAEVEELHAERLEKMFPVLTIPYREPLTKLLDEINYLP